MTRERMRLGRVRYKGRNAWLVALLRALLDPWGMARGPSFPARYRAYRAHLREHYGV